MSNDSPKGVIKLYLRHDQKLSDIGKYDDPEVTIYGPLWIEEGSKLLGQQIGLNNVMQIKDHDGESMQIKLDQFGLKELQMIARNEERNTSGVIANVLYEEVIKDRSVIYAIKDLVRQCVIIGRDRTTHFGGFRVPKKKQDCPVIVIDLIGLQFQQKYNSGRLVLIGQKEYKGLLDDWIFEKVVGEVKKSEEEAKLDPNRYIKCIRDDTYLDVFAYKKFVEHDFLLVCLALHDMLGDEVSDINLKFLKYGTGFFAGKYARILNKHISGGIYSAMEKLFGSGLNKIRSFEFPFYNEDQNIIDLCRKYSVKCQFTNKDALQKTEHDLITATTNCADPHVVAGNEMMFGSVDAAIAENLVSKANKFSPILNTKIKEKFINTEINCSKL